MAGFNTIEYKGEVIDHDRARELLHVEESVTYVIHPHEKIVLHDKESEGD